MQTSTILYSAIPQIARLQVDAQTRFEMLEILLPVVHNTTVGLEKTFLNQALILPEEAQKALAVGQSLRKSIVDGHVVVALQISQKTKAKKKLMALLGIAIHRAISNIGYLFFRNYQIYSQTPASLWGTLHILYQVARSYKLTDQSINDSSLHSIKALSIKAAYSRILMLAIAPTNKFTQSEINACFLAFERWCSHIELEDEALDKSDKEHFSINLLSNSGPFYKQRAQSPQPTGAAQHLKINFDALLMQLSKGGSGAPESGVSIAVPKGFSANILEHLIAAWSNSAYRKQNRHYEESSADVCVGITDVHYFMCNGSSFDRFLDSANSPVKQDIHELPGFSPGMPPASETQNKHNTSSSKHRVVIQNTSSGGYCVLWRDTISTKVTAGELLSVKELGQRPWKLCIIRWVRQLKNASQIGLQLIATDARPIGIAQNQGADDNSDYMRAFLIPASKLGVKRHTILAASSPLKELDTIHVINEQKQWDVKLDRVVFSTKSVQQFHFRNSNGADDQMNLSESRNGQKTNAF